MHSTLGNSLSVLGDHGFLLQEAVNHRGQGYVEVQCWLKPRPGALVMEPEQVAIGLRALGSPGRPHAPLLPAKP